MTHRGFARSIGLAWLLSVAQAQDVFGLTASDGFGLANGTVEQRLQQIDCFAASNDAVIYYDTQPRGHVYTPFANPEASLSNPEAINLCAFYEAERFTLENASGFAILNRTLQLATRLHYGSMVATQTSIYLLGEGDTLITVHRNGSIGQWTSSDPLLGLYDSASGVAYLALDATGFYFGFVDDPRITQRIDTNESIYVGGNVLNTQLQILKRTLQAVSPNSSSRSFPTGFVPFIEHSTHTIEDLQDVQSVSTSTSTSLSPPTTLSGLVVIATDSTLYLTVGPGTELQFFQDLQINGGTLVLDLGGAAYDTGDVLEVFAYASAEGQFQNIELVNYAMSSCLLLQAEGEFTGTHFAVTLDAEISCTSAASRVHVRVQGEI